MQYTHTHEEDMGYVMYKLLIKDFLYFAARGVRENSITGCFLINAQRQTDHIRPGGFFFRPDEKRAIHESR